MKKSSKLLILLFLVTVGCRTDTGTDIITGLDFFDRPDLLGIVSDTGEFIPLDTEVQEVKLGIVIRRALAFPENSDLVIKIPGVPQNARISFAVGVEGASDVVPQNDFIFSLIAEQDSSAEITPEWYVSDINNNWHDGEIDLTEYSGCEISIKIRAVDRFSGKPVYLAHPRLVVPDESIPSRVILICIDTLRSDAVGSYGCNRGLTPELDELAVESVRFANCESASTWTLPATAAALTGFFPGMIAADSVSEHLREEETTLAELFLGEGYRTGSAVNNRWVSSAVGFFQGNEYMIERSGYADADQAVDAAYEWIVRHIDEPFYFYIHLMDPHVPYSPPEPYLTEFRRGDGRFETEFDNAGAVWSGAEILTDGEKEQLRGLYDGEVAYADAELGRFFGSLKSLGIWDSTAVVIFADHGEEFWEHGGFEHGHSVYEEISHVPLLMKFPGIDDGVREERVSLVDVLPTIAGWAGLEIPEGVVGRDLFCSDNVEYGSRLLFIEDTIHNSERRASVQGDWKQILCFDDESEPELFNLGDDPGEFSNLYTSEPEIGEKLTTELLMYTAQTSEGCHVRLYPLEDLETAIYILTASVEEGEFSDIVTDYCGELRGETSGGKRIVMRVRFDESGFGSTGYIGLDFNVTPEDAPVILTAGVLADPDREFPWNLGASGEVEIAKEISFSMLDRDIAMSYPRVRRSYAQGVYVWSVPRTIRDELEGTLSPEMVEDLRALGYLQ